MYKALPPGYILKSTVIVATSGTLLYGAAQYMLGSEPFFKNQCMPILSRLVGDERVPQLALTAAKWGIMPLKGDSYREYDELNCEVFNKKFNNPVGIAAGFDKNGVAVKNLSKSGFGFVEVGSVTPLPHQSKEKQQIFCLVEDEAVINRCEFNNIGVGSVMSNLRKSKDDLSVVPIGVNISRNEVSEDSSVDYEIGVNYLGPFADYIVLNLSSNNNLVSQNLSSGKEIRKILEKVKKAVTRVGEKKPKVFLKINPLLLDEQKKELAKLVLEKNSGVDGLIIANATTSRPDSLKSALKSEEGGLSGKPLNEMSTECIKDFYRLTGGKVTIIGCGGVSCGKDAYDKIRAGASLVQLYTSLLYQGFPVVGRIKRELVELLRKDGFSNISEAVGAEHNR